MTLLEALAKKFDEMRFAKPKKIAEEVDPSDLKKGKGEGEGDEEELKVISEDGEEEEENEDDYDREIRIAIVGKPNVGKVRLLPPSSLLLFPSFPPPFLMCLPFFDRAHL